MNLYIYKGSVVNLLPYEIKNTVNIMIKRSSMFIIISIFLAIVLNEFTIGVAFSLGLTLAIFNFIMSGIILKNLIEKKKQYISMLIILLYIMKISSILLIGCFFIDEFKLIGAYITGIITYFPILIISWIRNRRLN